MGEQNCPFGGCAYASKVLFVAITDIDEVRFYSAGGCCGRPAYGNQAQRKSHWPQQLQACFPFAPCQRQGVLLGVDVNAFRAERCDGPFHCFGHLRGAGYASAHFVGETAQILFERGWPHDLRKNLRGRFRAG